MAEEPIIAAGGAGGDSGGAGAASDAGGGVSPDVSNLSDSDALSKAIDSPSSDEVIATEDAPSGKPEPVVAKEEVPADTEINLDALGEAEPEWLAKVTDAAAKTEISKLLDANKKFSEHFKDTEDLDGFFKELPGGREQIAAMQTLVRENAELDSALETNTPESLAAVAERYVGQTPDGGMNLLRATAQQMAKTNPESWNQVSRELINSSLNAVGLASDFPALVTAINEMRTAIANDDMEAFGRAAAKITQSPKSEVPQDSNITRLQEREQVAIKAERAAKVQLWENNVSRVVDSGRNFQKQTIGTALAAKDSQGRPLIPASIPEKSRQQLADRIYEEVDKQLASDSWLTSQIYSLVGSRSGDKHNLAATQEHFNKTLEISKSAITRLVPAVTKRIITEWSKELVASSREAIAKAKGSPQQARREPGGTAASTKGNRRLDLDDVIGPNAKSDTELLEKSLGL